jgi:hypothetical protein
VEKTMIVEVAAAAAMWAADSARTLVGWDQAKPPAQVQQHCPAGPEIAQCFQRKFEQLDAQQQQHDDMWDPNWISKVEPVERSAKGGRVRRTYTAPETSRQ